MQLRSGSLPTKLTIVEERTVGPSLGADSIEAGKLAGLVGCLATAILTIVAYGTFGVFAVIGLLVHGFLIIALMTVIGTTLTLPGIAGFVLTIGMAVDANVLIYERIREELRNGKSPIAAIDQGFQRAFITILDSQLTTLAAAVIMFWLGSGPIRGFAVTLTIGILTSVFAAVTVTRLLVVAVAEERQEQGPRPRSAGLERQAMFFPVPDFKGFDFFPHNLRLPFMRFKGLCLALSIVAMAVSLGLYFTRGLNYGVDFKGGSLIEVQHKDGPADLAEHAREAQRPRARRRADPELRRRHRRADPRRGAAGRRRRAAGGDEEGRRHAGAGVHAAAHRGGRAGGIGRAAAHRHHRRAGVARRHFDLRLVPLRMAVRGRLRRWRCCTTCW